MKIHRKYTADECKEEIQKTMAAFAVHIDKNSENLNLLRGFSQFFKRAQQYPLSRLESALHNFGLHQSTSVKVTSKNSLKWAKKGKIYVQPEAVKRHKTGVGSKKGHSKSYDSQK